MRASACIASLTLAVTSVASMVGAQDQSVQLEIRQSGAPQVALAAPTFLAGAGAAEEAALLHQVMRQDLDWSMVFDLVDPSAYPRVAPNEPIPWDQWRSSGARALLQGSVTREGDQLVVEVRLFDVPTGNQVDGRRYRSNSLAGLTRAQIDQQVRSVAHKINDEAVLYYTGVRGVASTQLAFISDRDVPNPQKELYISDYDGARQRRITFNTSITLSPSFSPGADRIAYQTYILRNQIPNSEVHLIRKTGGSPIHLVTCKGTSSGPSFSPDGRLVALASSCSNDPNTPADSEIYLVGADGTGLRRITRNPGADVSPSWAPNSDQIVFVSDRSGSQQLYVMDATGLNPRRLSTPGGQKDDPAWNPVRTKYIAFTASTGGNNFDIFLYDLETERAFQLTRGRGRKEAPAWSPDGRQLVFEWAQGDSIQIWIMGIDGTHQRMITSLGNNLTPAWGDE